MASVVGVTTPIVGALLLGSYVSCCMSSRRYVSLIITEKIIPKPKIFTETRAQDSFRVCALSLCNFLSEANKFCLGAFLLLCLVLELHKTSLVRIRTQGSVRCCDVCFYNPLFETNSFGLGAVLLSCLLSELQKLYSLGIEPRTVFGGSGLCFCNLIFKTNNSGLGAILLSCLVSELQETPSSGIELRKLFWSSDPPMFSSWSHGISFPSLVQIGISVLEL
jgi:hypothetical protein